jgi:hypothetical protein
MKAQPFKTALTIAFLLALFATAAGTSAQNHPVRVSVKPGNNTSSSQAVSTRLAGKIGATSRYALVTGATDTVDLYGSSPSVMFSIKRQLEASV